VWRGLFFRPYLNRHEVDMLKNFVNFLKAEDGPTAVEYAVMLALIIVVCIAAITALGRNANSTFSGVSKAIGGTSS
jgi:pilus assembly protein Flp/PilA